MGQIRTSSNEGRFFAVRKLSRSSFSVSYLSPPQLNPRRRPANPARVLALVNRVTCGIRHFILSRRREMNISNP